VKLRGVLQRERSKVFEDLEELAKFEARAKAKVQRLDKKMKTDVLSAVEAEEAKQKQEDADLQAAVKLRELHSKQTVALESRLEAEAAVVRQKLLARLALRKDVLKKKCESSTSTPAEATAAETELAAFDEELELVQLDAQLETNRQNKLIEVKAEQQVCARAFVHCACAVVLNRIFVKLQVTIADADALNRERAAQLLELHKRAKLALEAKHNTFAQREKCKLNNRLRIRRARRKLAAVEAGSSAKKLDAAVDAVLMAKDETDCAALLPRLRAERNEARAKEAARQEAARMSGNDPNEEMARMLKQHCEDMRQLVADLELERELRRAAVDVEAKLRDMLADTTLVARGAAPDERKATTDMIAAEVAQARAADDLQLERAKATQTQQLETHLATSIGMAVAAEIEDYTAAATALAEREARDAALLKASLDAEAQMRQARMRERLAHRKGVAAATLKRRGLGNTQITNALAAATSSFTAEVEEKMATVKKEEEAAEVAAIKQLEHQRRLQELHGELSRKHAVAVARLKRKSDAVLSEVKDQAVEATTAASDASRRTAESNTDQKEEAAARPPVDKLNAAKSRLARRVRRREEQRKAIHEKEQAAWRMNDEYAKKWSDREGELQATRRKEESLLANVQQRGTEHGIENITDFATAELKQFATLDAELRTAEASALREHHEAAARAMEMISEEAAKVTASDGVLDQEEPQETLSLVTSDAEVELQQLLDRTKVKLASEIDVRANAVVDQISTEAAVAEADAAAKHAETAVGQGLLAECIRMFHEQEGRLARLEEQLADAERRAADAERRVEDAERRSRVRVATTRIDMTAGAGTHWPLNMTTAGLAGTLDTEDAEPALRRNRHTQEPPPSSPFLRQLGVDVRGIFAIAQVSFILTD
jgi:hypothetical protein